MLDVSLIYNILEDLVLFPRPPRNRRPFYDRVFWQFVFFVVRGYFYVNLQMIWEWYIPIGMRPEHIPIKKVLLEVVMVHSLNNIFNFWVCFFYL